MNSISLGAMILGVLFLVFTLSGCATVSGPLDFDIKKDIFYTSARNQRQSGDLYLPQLQTSKPFPLVIAVHGGGFSGGNKTHMRWIAKSLASQGIAVFSMNYRLAPKYKHPTPYSDLTKAYDYLKKNAKKYNLDRRQIALWGYSAGGYIVSYFALRNSKNGPSKRPVKAVVAGGAPFDLTWYPLSPYFKNYLGAYRDRIPKKYQEASVQTHLSRYSPPFFIYHSIDDQLVEFSQATAFEFLLKKNKIPVVRHDVRHWGHTATFLMSKTANKAAVGYLKKAFIVD